MHRLQKKKVLLQLSATTSNMIETNQWLEVCVGILRPYLSISVPFAFWGVAAIEIQCSPSYISIADDDRASSRKS